MARGRAAGARGGAAARGAGRGGAGRGAVEIGEGGVGTGGVAMGMEAAGRMAGGWVAAGEVVSPSEVPSGGGVISPWCMHVHTVLGTRLLVPVAPSASISDLLRAFPFALPFPPSRTPSSSPPSPTAAFPPPFTAAFPPFTAAFPPLHCCLPPSPMECSTERRGKGKMASAHVDRLPWRAHVLPTNTGLTSPSAPFPHCTHSLPFHASKPNP
ncbi:unnamed protein product [Closterium sp. NIES-65]|nr:unnamed protein product [Closterium sp. NIES-65]